MDKEIHVKGRERNRNAEDNYDLYIRKNQGSAKNQRIPKTSEEE
jgi:hypothetical protein